MERHIISMTQKMQERNRIEELEDKVIQLNKTILENQPLWTNDCLTKQEKEIVELKKINKLNENKIKHLEDLNNISLINVIKCKISRLFNYRLNITIEKRSK